MSKFDYTYLLEFFARLVKRTPEKVYLVITGSDDHAESKSLVHLLDKLQIRERVKLILDFKDQEKVAILNCGDIFISLSKNVQESFGISLIEAMAAGLPVICTDWNGYKDIITDGVDGFRIPTNWKRTQDPEESLIGFKHPYDHSLIHKLSRNVNIDTGLLYEKAALLIHNADMRNRMGDNGAAAASHHFSIKNIIQQYQQLWKELGNMARNDTFEYKDLGKFLSYDYCRHFRSYPTEVI